MGFRFRRVTAWLAAAWLVPAAALAYGPYDYTNAEHVAKHLPVVEEYHFNGAVETLTGTMPGGSIGPHLAYVLRAFPNHHRALNAMAKYWRQHLSRGGFPPDTDPEKTPDYWFDRALEFAPDDSMAKALYAKHLLELKQRKRALELLDAAAVGAQGAELHYNLGLFYLQGGELEKARAHATEAYALNYPLPGLRDRLVAAGAWTAKPPAP
jgi:tetratricopeptide (TPR) repeat protein